MAITRSERFIYVARNAETGLTNVTAKVRRNGVYVLGTDTTPLPLAELDNGRYELVLSPAQLNTAGGAGYYDLYINSATKNAPAITARNITEKNHDDLEAHLATIESKVDSVQLDTNDLQVNMASVKATVEDTNSEVKDPLHGLSNLKSLIDMIQSTVSNISNVARFGAFMPSQLIRPAVGLKRYKIEMRLFDTNGNMEDPDGNITVAIEDEAGNSRASYLVGGANATAVSTGVFYKEIDIPSTADLEQLIIKFSYLENGIAFNQVATTQVVEEVQATGLALETTSQDILLDTADMQPRVLDIQTKVNDATYGLSALRALVLAVETLAQENNDILNNATFGLSALKNQIDLKASQLSVDAVQADVTLVKGTGFSSGVDSMKAVSDRTFFGGQSI